MSFVKLNLVLKTDRQTDRQTDRRTDQPKYRSDLPSLKKRKILLQTPNVADPKQKDMALLQKPKVIVYISRPKECF